MVGHTPLYVLAPLIASAKFELTLGVVNSSTNPNNFTNQFSIIKPQIIGSHFVNVVRIKNLKGEYSCLSP